MMLGPPRQTTAPGPSCAAKRRGREESGDKREREPPPREAGEGEADVDARQGVRVGTFFARVGESGPRWKKMAAIYIVGIRRGGW